MSETSSPEPRVGARSPRVVFIRGCSIALLIALTCFLGACSGSDDGGSLAANSDGEPDSSDEAQVGQTMDDEALIEAIVTEIQSNEPPSIDGEEVYRARCSTCHGGDGGGGIGPALSGIADRMSVDEHVDIVVVGAGTMPAFGSLLSPEEIAAVVLYERTGLTG